MNVSLPLRMHQYVTHNSQYHWDLESATASHTQPGSLLHLIHNGNSHATPTQLHAQILRTRTHNNWWQDVEDTRALAYAPALVEGDPATASAANII